MSRTEHQLEIEHDGAFYSALVEVEWTKVDDSFDGHAYGRPYTFESHHYEAGEHEVMELVRVNEDGEEPIEEDEVPGLPQAIREEVEAIDCPEY